LGIFKKIQAVSANVGTLESSEITTQNLKASKITAADIITSELMADGITAAEIQFWRVELTWRI
jgi:hypothetical protein